MVKKKKAAKKKPAPKRQTVGEQVKAAREGARMSQVVLAEIVDCSVSTIRDIEQDTPSSRTRILQSICETTKSRIVIGPYEYVLVKGEIRGRSRG